MFKISRAYQVDKIAITKSMTFFFNASFHCHESYNLVRKQRTSDSLLCVISLAKDEQQKIANRQSPDKDRTVVWEPVEKPKEHSNNYIHTKLKIISSSS